ncbi:hypothetical protein HMPREF0578_1354 [Mobiluncus mulieris 28-1]|uniref:Uncharacterized protein n=1 Tax=Mobiluncus mulieris ATCC 35239 TaxID=871571 RepID=E0QND0_9ACTO|nr:hypothetical protein HMPREF0577_2038 [Mobiluncus mulieris ATCC 35243]EEZ92025.1 hypothetical protein HMPREF0578_1354 [Mobiluncus mulieris 28-1]EFM46902.1 hypothetical protein HMPREF0580_0394 [Mobiluncus mulieris ATCC 35239]
MPKPAQAPHEPQSAAHPLNAKFADNLQKMQISIVDFELCCYLSPLKTTRGSQPAPL